MPQDESQKKQHLFTPASVVTVVRICLVPVFFVVLLAPWPDWFGLSSFTDQTKSIIATVVFVLVSCTDWLDGYLARHRNQVTVFGQFVDPLADKMLVAAALLALIDLRVLPSWPVLIILCREFVVAGVRMVAASHGEVIAASWYGKAKTVAQIVAIVLFLLKGCFFPASTSSPLEDPLYVISWIVLIIALILTIISMLDYIAKARNYLSKSSVPAASQTPSATDGDDAATSAASQMPQVSVAEGAASEQNGTVRDEANEIDALASRVVNKALNAGVSIGTAESLTGGMISTALTSVPGSSQCVYGGIVSYVNDVKHDVLDVDAGLLEQSGAVNEQCACEMAKGARARLNADICVAVTGIAGPTGAEPNSPVGTVWIALAHGINVSAQKYHFDGDREAVRLQTTRQALTLIDDEISSLN